MNHIPAVHFHTVVNALHESALTASRKARETDSPGERRAFEAVARNRFAAFDNIMRNAPVVSTIHNGVPGRYHECGLYRVPVKTDAA